jgi:hypothetical protein
MRFGSLSIGLVLTLAFSVSASASISFTGSTYSQDFNTLANTSAGDIAWTNDTTLAGWSLFNQVGGGTAITAYRADDGGANTARFYSYGSTNGDSERALGSLADSVAYYGTPSNGTVAGWIAVAFVNNTGSTINQITVHYDGEQWRQQSTNAQSLVLEWGLGSTFTTVGSWTAPGASFDFISPQHTGSGVVNGNSAAAGGGLVANIGGDISSVNWTAGSTLWIRFADLQDIGNDHGLAVDNFTFTTSSVPEPATLSLGGLALLIGAIARMRPRAK